MRGSRLRERAAVSIAILVWVATVTAGSLAIAFAHLAAGPAESSFLHSWLWILAVDALVVALATFGAVQAARLPARALGWLAASLGLGVALTMLTHEYVLYALDREPVAAGVKWAALAGALLVPAVILATPFFLLFAPEGRWGSRGWRRFAAPFAGLAGLSLVLLALTPGPLRSLPAIANPIGLASLSMADTVALWIGVPVTVFVLLVAVAAVPRPRGEEVESSVSLDADLDDDEDDDDEEGAAPLDEYARLKILRKRRKESKKAAFHFFGAVPRMLPYLRPYWKLAVVSIGLMGVSVLVGLIAPWPLGILLDSVLGSKPLPSVLGFLDGWSRRDLIALAVVSGLLVTALASSVGVVESYVSTRISMGMELDVRSALFEHCQRLSDAFHSKKKTGGLMFTINQQAGAVGDVLVALPPLFAAAATLVGMFAIAYIIDPTLALISIAVVPFIYLSTGYYAKKIEPRIYYVRNLEGQSMTIVYEAISMLRIIVSFGRERHEYRRFRTQAEEAINARVGLTVRQTLFSLAVNMITAAGTALVLGVGAWHVINNQLTAGELVVILGYIAAVYTPLEEISTTVAGLQQMFINAQMALDLLDTEPEIVDKPDAVALERAEGRVTFERVSFKHAGRKRRALKRVSFDAPPGSRVGIVGATGAGKTTLVNLIPRFYDAERGRVLVDGLDVKDLALRSLRAQISIVQQDPLLFSDTIRDNIRYGRLEATKEEVIEAAKAANAHDFVSALPRGYRTKLGEGGSLLSGGERQRLSIARAFLKDAPILILDEPTAAIDSHTELVILDALDRLAGNRTTFMIAHRLSTLGRADLILVLDHGRVVESGTHEELMAMPEGLYRRTYEIQSGRALHAVPSPPVEIAPAPPPYAGPAEPLIEALRLLLQARPEDLEAISTGSAEPLEIRLAAGILGVLSREDREKLRALDDAQLVAMLDEVRR